MLYSYEHFVVGGQGCADREAFDDSRFVLWTVIRLLYYRVFFRLRDSLVCFDKASFLSDQPDSHLAFLAAFLETQVSERKLFEKVGFMSFMLRPLSSPVVKSDAV